MAARVDFSDPAKGRRLERVAVSRQVFMRPLSPVEAELIVATGSE